MKDMRSLEKGIRSGVSRAKCRSKNQKPMMMPHPDRTPASSRKEIFLRSTEWRYKRMRKGKTIAVSFVNNESAKKRK
jgi:hypothetical protein